VRPPRLTLVGPRASTIAALVEAELTARGQSLDVLHLAAHAHRFGGERLVEVHFDDASGRPDLVIDTDSEDVVAAAEKVLAFIDGSALG